MIVPQTESILSPIHHHRGLYFYHMNYYEILKEHVQVLHKTQPEYFQIAHDKLSVMNFPLVEIGKHFPMRFVLCKDIEMFSIKNNT